MGIVRGKNLIVFVLALVGLFVIGSFNVYAVSDAEFPTDWESWPIISSGLIPGSDVPITDDLPAIIQETFKTYNWVQDGKGTAYNVRIHPDQKEIFLSGSGEFIDGPTGILELVDIKVLFITEHLLGDAQYGVYTNDGKDLSEGVHASLSLEVCNTCHTGYKEFFVNGASRK